MRLEMMGPPGAGKTFIGQAVAKKAGVPFIDVSDLLQDEAAHNPDVAETMAHGDLVSPDVTARLVDARLAQPDARKGWVMAGYGRDLADAHHLIDWTRSANVHDVAFVGLQVPTAVLLQRLGARGRSDDKPDVIAHRLEVYQHDTVPVVTYLKSQHLYHEVDANGSPEEVQQRVLEQT
ncbi:MAG TPA: nucleoside monophosphate kinase [Candidatus Xenobia bacterium]|jgi:adenylate kinase